MKLYGFFLQISPLQMGVKVLYYPAEINATPLTQHERLERHAVIEAYICRDDRLCVCAFLPEKCRRRFFGH